MGHNRLTPRMGEQGYTITELAVIIIILAIIAIVTILSGREYAVAGRDSERYTDVKAIAEGLERYYRSQAVAAGVTYPSTSYDVEDFAEFVLDEDALVAPGQTTNSIVMAGSNATQTPTASQYIYQPLSADGSLCTSEPCTRYILYYRDEKTKQVAIVHSMRQQ